MVNACLSYELTGLIAGFGVTVGLLTNTALLTPAKTIRFGTGAVFLGLHQLKIIKEVYRF